MFFHTENIKAIQHNQKEGKMKKIGLILVLFVILAGCATTEQPKAVGKPAPEFTITDVSGDEVRLADFKGKKNIVLVFYSDSTWPYSREQLGGLQGKISEIKKLDTEVIAFATEGDTDDVKITQNDLDIAFILIPTPNSSVVNAYGVDRYATIIIDKRGIIRYQVGQVFPSASSTLKKLQAL